MKTQRLSFMVDYFKGRKFRGQKISRFCGFCLCPRKFMSAMFFKIGHPQKSMSPKMLKFRGLTEPREKVSVSESFFLESTEA